MVHEESSTLLLAGYEAWFDEIVEFWLYTWRDKAEQMVGRLQNLWVCRIYS